MEVLKLASSRGSVRRFRSDPIPFADVGYVLEVARRAPSGANRQPWRFLVIQDNGLKKRIRERCEEVERRFHERAEPSLKEWLKSRGITWEKPFLTEAPILILVFGRMGEPYWVESVWLAIGFMLLAIEELGYSTLTYTPSEVDWVNDLLKVPKEYRLQAILPMGKPLEDKRPQDRLPLNEIAYLDEWGKGFQKHLDR